MKIHFEVLTTEITLNREMTVYNRLWWDMKPNRFGITHLTEKYDDVCEHTASYEFFRNGEMLCSGEGDPIPEEYIGVGGVSVMVQIGGPEYILK